VFGEVTYSIVGDTGASFGGYTMDNVMERSWSAGQVACGIEHLEAVGVRVRVIGIECTEAILTGGR
jgi:hypothetical protein